MKFNLFFLFFLLMGTLFGQNSQQSQYAALRKVDINTYSKPNATSPYSENSNNDFRPAQDIKAFPHSFTVGGKYTRAYLKPSANPSFSGNMGGARATYQYQRPNFFYGALDFEWKYGHLHASNGKRNLQDIIGEERLGYTFQVTCPENIITLFSGFGFRQLWHDIHLNNKSSIDFRYNHFYIPIGVFSQFKTTSFLSIGLNVTWFMQVFPTLTITPLNGVRWKLRRQFKNFLIELPFSFLDVFVKNLSILLVPQFELWKDGPTTARTPSGLSLGLPGNTYVLWSGELKLKYSF